VSLIFIALLPYENILTTKFSQITVAFLLNFMLNSSTVIYQVETTLLVAGTPHW